MITIDRFPFMNANLTGRTRQNFEKALAAIDAGLEKGEIANPVYQDTKTSVARAIEKAWGALADMSMTQDERDFFYQISAPQAHTIPGTLKKVTKAPPEAARIAADMRTLLEEIGPLGVAIVRLKDMVVKRQPKPVEDRKERYSAPHASRSGVATVKALLEQITDEAYQGLLANITASYERLVARYLDLAAEVAQEGLRGPAYKKMSEMARDNTILYRVVVQDTNETGRYYRIADGHEAVIAAEAKRDADSVREHFIYKNLGKIASILEAKGNFVEAKLLDRTILNALEGTIRFSFADGSSFIAKNSVVFVVNQYGTQFYRFPLTFSAVVMPDGSLMKQPSEERMNTVFAKA